PQTRDNALGRDLISDAAPPPLDGRSKPLANASTAAFGSRSGGPSSSLPIPAARPAKQIEPPVNPLLLQALARPAPQVGGAAIPEARDVLDALQIAGVYEPEGAVGPQAYAWSKPERVRRIFSTLTLIGLALLLAGGGVGTYRYVTDKRAKEHVEAEQ